MRFAAGPDAGIAALPPLVDSTTRFVGAGYHEEDVEIWDSAGTLVAQSRPPALVLPL